MFINFSNIIVNRISISYNGFMHEIQEKIMKLAQSRDLSNISLRELGVLIKGKEISPGILQHHFSQLEKKGLLFIDRKTKTQRIGTDVTDERFYNVPIVGAANCGDANIVAEENVEGYLKISRNKLRNVSDNLIAVRAAGDSMNDAKIPVGKKQTTVINDGDYVIIDRQPVSLEDNLKNKYVLSIIGGMANIKKLTKRQFDIALLSESKDQKKYPPIIISEGDDYLINGRVVQVVPA